MKAGIVVDDWKLPVFRAGLTAAGYEYADRGPGPGATTILLVMTDDLPALATIVARCQVECDRKGKPI